MAMSLTRGRCRVLRFCMKHNKLYFFLKQKSETNMFKLIFSFSPTESIAKMFNDIAAAAAAKKDPKTAWKMCKEFSVTNIDAVFSAQKFFMSFASKKFPAFINQLPVNRCVLMMMMSWITTNKESPLVFLRRNSNRIAAAAAAFFVLFQQIITRVSRANNFSYAMQTMCNSSSLFKNMS